MAFYHEANKKRCVPELLKASAERYQRSLFSVKRSNLTPPASTLVLRNLLKFSKCIFTCLPRAFQFEGLAGHIPTSGLGCGS